MSDDAFTPPLSIGLHLTEEDGRFISSVSLRNPRDDPVSLTTMSGRLFSIDMLTKRDVLLWGSEQMATQAVTHWELGPNSRITKHFQIPNEADAQAKAEKLWEEHEWMYDEFDDYRVNAEPKYVDMGKFRAGLDDIRTEQASERVAEDGETKVFNHTAVDPTALADIIKLEASIPATYDHSIRVTRQYDLRRSLDALDDSLPTATLDAISRTR